MKYGVQKKIGLHVFIFQEMWALFDFVTHGSVLGTIKTFMMEYGNPITRVRIKALPLSLMKENMK